MSKNPHYAVFVEFRDGSTAVFRFFTRDAAYNFIEHVHEAQNVTDVFLIRD